MNQAVLQQALGQAAGDRFAQRQAEREMPQVDDLLRALHSRLRRCVADPLPWPLTRRLALARRQADQLDALGLPRAVRATTRALRQQGLAPGPTARALALAARAMVLAGGHAAYDTQLQAAWLMLRGQLAEMATGEGKTLATALAAGVAGLCGQPVHVVTANDYLVERDSQALAPYFAQLGLRCARVTGATPPSARAALWRHQVVYTTARELAFDYLRDHVTLAGERDGRLLRAQAIERPGHRAGAHVGQPVLPGLHFALIDEADSVLLDEAIVPLLLAQSVPASEADLQAWQRVYALSGTLLRQRDYQLRQAQRRAVLTDAGRDRVARAVQGQAGLLSPARRACELVEAALAARWLYRRDHDYLVTDGKVQLIDTLTGRVADGRQWQGALQPMVELKEQLTPSHPTTTAAQITYQRFFPRYLRLGGMSGTLREARHELQVVYGTPVTPVPLARPGRRQWLGQQVWADAGHKWRAVQAAVQAQAAAGRPVLVGTDSVADSLHLAALLQRAGLPHQVLNARQDADEAQAVARAGRAGMVTVATNIAGRGTDIQPDAEALAAGGLHVIATMRNRSRRIDRQLSGRAARQGDPGSAEAILALDDALPAAVLPPPLLQALAGWAARRRRGRVPDLLGRALMALAQRLAERQDAQRRDRLRQADRQAQALHGFGGQLE
jgi:preprotein translocase subunit SecA